MIYVASPLEDPDRAVLEQIEGLRSQLRHQLVTPRRWYGTLRRATLARAVQASNSIEGYHASVEDVAAVIDGEEPLDADEETRLAIAGYRDAMTYSLALASSESAQLDTSALRAMHFMMLKYDLGKHPGQWRPGAVWVEDQDGNHVYEAPERSMVDELVGEHVHEVNDPGLEPIVQAAMAHLNLALIHPFSDGNGRLARCVQSFVLARGGLVAPEFLSIEEYLGRNTRAYYDVLTEVAAGTWSPQRSTRPWIRFCLTAHYRQATTVLRRITETEALWDACEQLVAQHGLPTRSVGPLCDAARGWRLQRTLYVKTVRSSNGEEISPDTATRDLSALTSAGLLIAEGAKRGRSYRRSERLAELRTRIRVDERTAWVSDPYLHTAPQLPGIR